MGIQGYVDGKKKQMFQFGGKTTTKEILETIGREAIDRMKNGMSSEDAKAYCKDRVSKL